ncbi:maleylacetoacetate isomerase [Vibrio sp. SCSIO 43135]|uniref:maleylacetoacetate isomerase n=1 Tax=Vibrio sp. SCSIO 43135 TaxID=2819096 RepID=UPI0020764504|nr:maleylacetoacetate isomerase [Vibrio sp. SCSIO 43135]USD42377.1 maleylacetoacetate isomerase [Vibrio sp. SCSIO 43135]
MSNLTLYGYWRSSAAYRVRIALNLKQLDYTSVPVHLVKDGGQQHATSYSSMNASELVPVLVDGDLQLNQSLSIIDYLDENYAGPLLTPESGDRRYLVKSLAQDIAIDVHPINNLRVMQYLSKEVNADDNQKLNWTRHWIELGFHALEKKLASASGTYCVGDEISLVDVCLVPQVYNAERFGVDMSAFPIIQRVVEVLRVNPAFIKAAPENQPDADY